MNLVDLTVNQLKRAVAIKERIENLSHELRRLLGGSNSSRPASTKSRAMSAAIKRKIAASQKARWAKLRRAKSGTRPAEPAATQADKKTAPAAPAKLPAKKATKTSANARRSAKLKAYWATKKKAGKG